MLRHHLTYFYRFLARHRKYAFVNLFGLVLGIAAFVYIADYAAFEESFDDYHRDADRILRVTSQKIQDGVENPRKSSASVALGPFLESFTEVEQVARVHIFDNERHIVTIEDPLGNQRKYEERNGFHAEENYFNIFSDQLVAGNSETCLQDPFSIVLTESLAAKYFPKQQALGKTLQLMDEDVQTFTVTGIVKDRPANSHFQYDYLVSLKTMETLWHYARWTSWDWDFFHTYIKVRPGVNLAKLEQEINSRVAAYGREAFAERNYQMDYQLQALRDIHLHSDLGRELSVNGNGESLGYLKVIGLLILLLAYVNYINLVTAASGLRAKEIGIRKVTGAPRSFLRRQFLVEALCMNFLALIAAIGLIAYSAPYLSMVTGHDFQWLALEQPMIAVTTLLWVSLGVLISGLYPAIVLSRLEPSRILKGSFKSSSTGINLRRWLVIIQFAASILLVCGTLGIYLQIDFLRNRDLGIQLDQVVAVHSPNERSDNFWNEFDYLRNQAEAQPGIRMMSGSNQLPGNILYHVELYKQGHQNITEAKVLKHIWVDYDYSELYDLEVMAGRDYDPARTGDERSLLLNASAARLLGFEKPEDAVDKAVTWVHSYGALDEMKCIGVVEDFDQSALGSSEPMAFIMNRFFHWYETGYFLFKIQPDNMEESLAFLREEYEKLYPQEQFTYYFMDRRFAADYASEINFGKLFLLFAVLAIFIANLGLLGLIAFIVQQRTKEITIRKVLGATLTQILSLLTRSFSGQLLIAVALAVPVAFVLLRSWLERFSYRMELSPLLFTLPILLIAVLYLLTCVSQSVGVARQNPVKHLRKE